MLARSSRECGVFLLRRLCRTSRFFRNYVHHTSPVSLTVSDHMRTISTSGNQSTGNIKNVRKVRKLAAQDDITESHPMLADYTEAVAGGSSKKMSTMKVVPGQGPPPEPPVECCMSGCANCVWIAYAESLKEYYKDGGKSAEEALDQIENQSLKMFVKLELGL